MRLPLDLPARRGRPWDVLALGENSHDIVVQLDGHPPLGAKVRARRIASMPGGQIATAAAALARLGWRTAYAGAFGDDEPGRTGVESLEAAGVDCAHVVRVDGAASRTAVILVDSTTGERTVLWHRDLAIAIAAVPAPVHDARVLLLDDHGEAAVAAAREARAAGTRTVVDVESPRPDVLDLLRAIDVVIAARGFAEAVTGVDAPGRALAALQEACGATLVCATLGVEGSLARVGGREVRTPAFAVPVVDTTGAGDLFRAGFIAAWLEQGDEAEVEDLLRYANATAALGCRGVGARGRLPRRAEVEALLRGQTAPE